MDAGKRVVVAVIMIALLPTEGSLCYTGIRIWACCWDVETNVFDVAAASTAATAATAVTAATAATATTAATAATAATATAAGSSAEDAVAFYSGNFIDWILLAEKAVFFIVKRLMIYLANNR